MKTIDQLDFYTETDRSGKFIGRVVEFPKLRSRPRVSRIVALDEIIEKASNQLRDMDDSRARAAGGRT